MSTKKAVYTVVCAQLQVRACNRSSHYITSFLNSPPFLLAAIGAFSYSFDESLLQSVIESVLPSSPPKNRKQYLFDKNKSNLLKAPVFYKLDPA